LFVKFLAKLNIYNYLPNILNYLGEQDEFNWF